MYRDPGSEPRGPLAEARQNVSALVALLGLVAAPLSALTARLGTLGERYTGLPMFFGVVAQFLIVGLSGGPTAGQQAGLLTGATLLVLALHRAKRASARRRWGNPHSMYTGTTRGSGDELAKKGVRVPVLALFVGLVLAGPLPGIAAWVISASVAQALTVSAYRYEIDARARALRDARIDQEVLRQHEEGR